MLPERQEVSSASCHSPLSCGHFLLFCQNRSVLLTQRTEVVLLAVGPGRTGGKLSLATSNFRLPSLFTTFILITIHQNKGFQCGRLHIHPFFFSPMSSCTFCGRKHTQKNLLLRQGYCHGFIQVKIRPK